MKLPEQHGGLTLTGVDTGTYLRDLEKLANQRPWLEFGVLLHFEPETATDPKRYPTLSEVQDILGELSIKTRGRVSLHLCGGQAREELYNHRHWMRTLFRHCSRVQLNFPIVPSNAMILRHDYPDTHFILQTSNAKDSEWWRDYGKQFRPGFSHLMDSSRGRGRLPEDWHECEVEGAAFGFAGGLNEENLPEQLGRMPKGWRWVDIESGVRAGPFEAGTGGFSIYKAHRLVKLFEMWRVSQGLPAKQEPVRL